MATQAVTVTKTVKGSAQMDSETMRGGKYVKYEGADSNEHFIVTVLSRSGKTPSSVTVTYT